MAGRRPLSRARILTAAMGIADKQGLSAVSMRSVAAKLGVEGMSLYHHVPNKQALLDGLVDLVIQQAELPDGDVTPEQWVRGSADALRTLARVHPNLVAVLSSRAIPLVDPATAPPFEAGLRAFTAGGRSIREAYAAMQATLLSLLSLCMLEAEVALEGVPTQGSAIDTLPLEEFPLLHAVADEEIVVDDFWQTLTDSLVEGLT